ncbi:WAT1-related protein At5g40230-like isoform X2 [Carya illinoinensis]|uniref:WAT1-related protein At5g40230-like isoform X2 n=1 Tax=Carya illinoinensis TaxID=32201 RepID=UPI001C71B4F2|nr:WAT1-related protein At5g40230-like isoform X2 [Carya illinoinensis]
MFCLFLAMVACESINVVLNVLFKAATLKGLSYHVFMAYSYAVSTLVLLPLAVFSGRNAGLPALELSLLYRIFLLGLFGYGAQICGYKGIEYSSPTLASAISNLTPAFTFILAVIFRMEQLALRRSSTLAKVVGTVVSISGALVVVLYEGPTLISISSQLPSLSLPFILGSSQTNWVVGGLLLAVECLMFSIWYIVQGISSSFMAVDHSWGLRLKGPVYISIFKPLSIAIAAAMGVIFLGDALYLRECYWSNNNINWVLCCHMGKSKRRRNE